MDEVIKKNGIMMIGYGGLIKVHREKDFVDQATGKYIDDDFDMLVSLDTVSLVATMEPELYERLGWTMRAFVDKQGYFALMQMMASCGHTPIASATKVESSEPAIELYPLAASLDGPDGSPVVKEIWQCNSFAASMILPPKHIDFQSGGSSRLLHLQTPKESFDFLECIYGNWTVPSSKHAAQHVPCGLSTKT